MSIFVTELDCITYLISASLMWLVGGSWKVSDRENKLRLEEFGSGTIISKIEKVFQRCNQMTRYGAEYIWSSSLLPLVLIKASGGIIFGAADPLNVQFAHVEGDSSNDGKRLGMIYASLVLSWAIDCRSVYGHEETTNPHECLHDWASFCDREFCRMGVN